MYYLGSEISDADTVLVQIWTKTPISERKEYITWNYNPEELSSSTKGMANVI